MKHIKWDSSLKVCGGLWGRAEAEIIFFSEYGHDAYQIKACSNTEANILATDTLLTGGGGGGSKYQTIFLAHPSHWLKLSYCDDWMSVVRLQWFVVNNCFNDIS